MPTLPLYTPNPGHPDASHNVIAPGGYERWYFDAESTTGDVVIVATFAQGTPDHPNYCEYLARHAKYLRRPTRHPPPVPGDYAWVSLLVYEQGRTVARSTRAIPPGAFRASAERLELTADTDVVVTEPDGSLRLRMAGADMTFRPTRPAVARELIPPSPSIAMRRHHWVIAMPPCAVEGTLRVDGGRSIAFSGRGYHDHQYGTSPMPGWLRGRVIGADRVVAFNATSAQRVGPGPFHRGCFAHWVEADADGVRESIAEFRFEAARYPTSIEVEQKGIRLERPTVLESSGSIDRLTYAVTGTGSLGGTRLTVLCEWY